MWMSVLCRDKEVKILVVLSSSAFNRIFRGMGAVLFARRGGGRREKYIINTFQENGKEFFSLILIISEEKWFRSFLTS